MERKPKTLTDDDALKIMHSVAAAFGYEDVVPEDDYDQYLRRSLFSNATTQWARSILSNDVQQFAGQAPWINQLDSNHDKVFEC